MGFPGTGSGAVVFCVRSRLYILLISDFGFWCTFGFEFSAATATATFFIAWLGVLGCESVVSIVSCFCAEELVDDLSKPRGLAYDPRDGGILVVERNKEQITLLTFDEDGKVASAAASRGHRIEGVVVCRKPSGASQSSM